MKQQPYELRRRLYIMFKGEEGLDYGGIARLVGYIFVCSRVVTSLLLLINSFHFTSIVVTEVSSQLCALSSVSWSDFRPPPFSSSSSLVVCCTFLAFFSHAFSPCTSVFCCPLQNFMTVVLIEIF